MIKSPCKTLTDVNGIFFVTLNSTALYCVAVAVFCMFGRTEPIILCDNPTRHSQQEDYPVSDGDAARLLQSESESDLEVEPVEVC